MIFFALSQPLPEHRLATTSMNSEVYWWRQRNHFGVYGSHIGRKYYVFTLLLAFLFCVPDTYPLSL